MNPRDRFDELEREHRHKSELGAELLGFIDDAREPFEFDLDHEDEADEVDEADLKSMGLAPFLKRDEFDD